MHPTFPGGLGRPVRLRQATLTPSAEETLNALLPLLAKAGKHPARVEVVLDSCKKGD